MRGKGLDRITFKLNFIGLSEKHKKKKVNKKLKWILIAIFLIVLMIAILYFIVPHNIMPILSNWGGMLIGYFCMSKYLDERE